MRWFILTTLILFPLGSALRAAVNADGVYVPDAPESLTTVPAATIEEAVAEFSDTDAPELAAAKKTAQKPQGAVKPGGGVRFVMYNGKRYVYLRDVADYYKMQPVISSKTCALYGKKFQISMFYDKTYAFVNGLLVHLFYPPVYRNGNAMLSEVDFLRQLDPIFRDYSLTRHVVRTIMIDPGHGGKDEGGRGRLYREKDITLRLGIKLKKALEKMGYKVLMTRTGDQTLTLDQRADMTTAAKADLFISIHCNKTTNRSVCGLETFIMPATGTPSTYGSSNNGKAPGNRLDGNNTRLGYEVHSSVREATSAYDRGLKRARFFVIRNANCPSVLIETGFLSNRFEERRLAEDSYQDKIVDGIVKGIYTYQRAMLKNR